MSYNFGKRLRQPGGRLTVCRPETGAQLESEISAAGDGGPTVTPNCDCFFCNNNGRPSYALVAFQGFWGDGTGGSGPGFDEPGENGNCASLNQDNAANFPYPNPNGFECDFTGSNCDDGVDEQIVVWTDSTHATNPFSSAGCSCSYTGSTGGRVGNPGCSAAIPDFVGTTIVVTIGWSEQAGVFVIVQLWGGDGPGHAHSLVLYQWNWHHLETYNDPPSGGWPIGQINCCGDASQRNSLFSLLTAAQGSPTGPNALEGGWVFELSASDPPSPTCYICDGPGGMFTSQPEARAGVNFSAGGDTRVLPPCCCGQGHTPPSPCFFACFQLTPDTGYNETDGGASCCDNNCGDGPGPGGNNCLPVDGIVVELCWNKSANAWTGTGPGDTNPMQVTLTRSGDTWTICYGCPGDGTCVDLTPQEGGAFLLAASCQSIGNCGACGCLDITISSVPSPCPPTISGCNGPPTGHCGCPPGVALPDSILVTLKGAFDSEPPADMTRCGKGFVVDPDYALCCSSIDGEYVLDYEGTVCIGDGCPDEGQNYCVYTCPGLPRCCAPGGYWSCGGDAGGAPVPVWVACDPCVEFFAGIQVFIPDDGVGPAIGQVSFGPVCGQIGGNWKFSGTFPGTCKSGDKTSLACQVGQCGGNCSYTGTMGIELL